MKSRPTADFLPSLFSLPSGVVVTFLLFSLIPLLVSRKGIEGLRRPVFVVELVESSPPVTAEPPRPAIVRPAPPPVAIQRKEVPLPAVRPPAPPPPRSVAEAERPPKSVVERPELPVVADAVGEESDGPAFAVSSGPAGTTQPGIGLQGAATTAGTEAAQPRVPTEASSRPVALESPPGKPAPVPVPFFKLTATPRFVHRETPVYPQEMKAIGSTGSVKVEALIDDQGNVVRVTVLRSAGPAFDRAAIEAMRASLFAPGRIDGTAVAVLYRTEVHFRLR